jgi:hypothetical protein
MHFNQARRDQTEQGARSAELSEAIPGQAALALCDFDLADLGYGVEEFFLSGSARSYRSAGPKGRDGRWSAKPHRQAAFRTRLVVVRPLDTARFNGVVVVEWLNVSAGADTAPEWGYTHRELIRSGYAWVGVSVQKAGIEGGGFMSFPGMEPLKKAAPDRYATLAHPGDAFGYDIFTQAARAVRAETERLLGASGIRALIAAGESQSASRLTTYINAIAPLETVFDGFLVHSRFGGAPGLQDGFAPLALLDALKPVHIRTDTQAPVLIFITETDLMMKRFGYLHARQPDHEKLRTWEVAGTAHADTYVMGASSMDSGSASAEALAGAMAPTRTLLGLELPQPINAAPQHHYVMMAALSALTGWATGGPPPPEAPRLELSTSTGSTLALDAVGNAMGGVRSPWMDAPAARLSGLAKPGSRISALFGSTEPLTAGVLDQLYPQGRDDYLGRFESSLSRAIDAGFILPADRTEIESLASIGYGVS